MKKKYLVIIYILFIFACLQSCLNTAPTVFIESPQNNDTFFMGDQIEFKCIAEDNEDANIVEDYIVWSSDKDGRLGTGSSLIRYDLSVNKHKITVNIEDSKEAKADAGVEIVVIDNQ